MRYINNGIITPKNQTHPNNVCIFTISVFIHTYAMLSDEKNRSLYTFSSFTYNKTPYNLIFNDFSPNTEHKPDYNLNFELFL